MAEYIKFRNKGQLFPFWEIIRTGDKWLLREVDYKDHLTYTNLFIGTQDECDCYFNDYWQDKDRFPT